MIHCMKNILTILMITVISKSDAAPPKRYTDYINCKDKMAVWFGNRLKTITPFECFQIAITKWSIYYSVDSDVNSYVETFYGKYDAKDIDVPQKFCSDTVTDMYKDAETDEENLQNKIDESMKECMGQVEKFGERSVFVEWKDETYYDYENSLKGTVLDNALKYHKQGVFENWEDTIYYHTNNTFGWQYLDHIKDHVNSLKEGVVDDLVTPRQHCRNLHKVQQNV